MNVKLDIPESFYQGEERCGYYVSPEMKKVWAVELDLIAEFARVCEKYNIKWFADAGTLLGAVRHKGFIPWDDDVDLIMMREDYDRFFEVAKKEFKYPYVFDEFYNEAKLLVFHPKIYNTETTLIDNSTKNALIHGGRDLDYRQNIFIDIFILDNIPDSEIRLKMMFMKAYVLLRLSGFFHLTELERYVPANHKAWKRPLQYIFFHLLKMLRRLGVKLPSHKKYFHRLLDLLTSYNSENTRRIANLAFIDNDYLGGDRVIQKRSDYNDIIYLPFEMLTIPVPSGFEGILNQLYGEDWREFKITHNHGTFFDPERPYTYYLDEGHHFEFKEFNAHL